MANHELPLVGILASGDRASGGGGSTAERVIRDTLDGSVEFNIGVVICNNPPNTVGVYDKVDGLNRQYGLRGDAAIDVVYIGPGNHPEGKLERGQTTSESAAICQELASRDIDFVAALGYLRIVTAEMADTWLWRPEYGANDTLHNGIYHPNARVMNNHPSILPFTADTHGHGAHERAMELHHEGIISHSAMTWHMMAAGVDNGPVVQAEPVKIHSMYNADKLSDAVQWVEKDMTAEVLEAHLILRNQHLLAAAASANA